MAKSSGSKKVARASKAGGRRVSGEKRSVVFPALMTGVVVLGMFLIVVSRGREANATPPLLSDHWHDAFAVYDCDTFLPPLNDGPNTNHQIHAHGDGLIHIHPNSNAYTGRKAKLSVFAESTGMKLADDSFELADGTKRKDGDKCGDDEGIVQLLVWKPTQVDPSGTALAWDEKPAIFTTDPGDYHFDVNGALVVLAFAPRGADIPQPPSKDALASPSDLPGATPTTAPAPAPAEGSTTTAPESPTTTAPEGDQTTTTAAG